MTTPQAGAPPVPLTFVLPGFSKCGTTTLISMVAQHPEIAMPSKLEPWFFIEDDFDRNWDWYRGLYPADLSSYRAIGDDSTAYTSHRVIDATSERLAHLYPDAKYLFIARDPVTRLESSYREFHSSGPKFGINAPFDLDEAIADLPQLVQDSCYWSLIGRYRDRVAPDRIKVVFFEDLVRDPDPLLRDVFSFLGVDPSLVTAAGAAPQLNRGEQKLRDTRLLRRLRNTPGVGPMLAKVDIPQQDRMLARVGLRRTDPQAPAWTPGALALVRDVIAPDAAAFQAEYGAPRSGWRRLAEVLGDGAEQPTGKGV